ncbi:MAG: hypothetical protein NZ602_09285 [Thermoguttaceae bacterium]|nr:hypothetical protein [Thermoguttaceae bacterium]MDW8038432.1 hypothetical protein [Thermoguttaceae bacterium]
MKNYWIFHRFWPNSNGLPSDGVSRRFWGKAKGLLPPETVIWVVAWLVLMWAGRERLFQDPGTFWHLAWGNQILETGRLPRVEQFSFTRAGQPVVADQWLAEVLMALMHRLTGWDGLLLLTATCLACVYSWMGNRLIQAGLNPGWVALLLAIGFLASAHNFHCRPLIATLCLLPLWFAGLLAVERKRRQIGYLWIFVPISALWANLHGGILAGLGTLFLCAIFWMLIGWRNQLGPVQSAGQAVHLLVITMACFAAVLVNPYGLQLPKTWDATLRMNLGQWIQEHRAWGPGEPAGWAAMALAGVYLVLLGRRIRDGQLLASWTLPLIWFCLGLQRVRNLPLFAEIALVALADLAGPPSPNGLRDAPQTNPCPYFPWPANRRKYLIPTLLVSLAVGLYLFGAAVPVVGSGWVRFSPERWPVGLLPQLQSHSHPCPDECKIFNDLEFGGWLIYFAPQWRVFIDDRCALYGEDFLAAYHQARFQSPDQLNHWQQEYRFRWALVRQGSRLDRYLCGHPYWQQIGRDQAAGLYRFVGP